MPTKCFLVKVELIIQKISCPGVWLCSNGKVTLQLGMLDSTIQTESYKPTFPITIEEKFTFYKTFVKERRLNELQRSLGKEWLFAELVQWKTCDEGVVLACFKTTLDDLLYPSAFSSANMPGTDVDLLLEPTKLFPGTIAPKLELRTKTTIEETISEVKPRCGNKLLHNNPVKSSCFTQSFPKKLHARKVCHTASYSRAQQRCKTNTKKESRPIFKYKKAEDDLILRTNPEKVFKDDIIVALNKYDLQTAGYEAIPKVTQTTCTDCISFCYCSDRYSPDSTNTRSILKNGKTNNNNDVQPNENDQYCTCAKHHEPHMCSICTEYESTFFPLPKKQLVSQAVNTTDSLIWCTCCSKHCAHKKGSLFRPSEKKVCFLPRVKNSLNLAQKLQESVRNGLQHGAACMETCFGGCQT